MNEWFVKSTRKSDFKDARLGKYYQKKGLQIPNDMIEVVLRTYQQKLQGQPTNHEDILYPFQLKQLKYNEEDKVRFTTDSLRGNYIPINLEDCLSILDLLYPDSLKVEIMNITEDEYISNYHLFGVGVWMRNNWQLWGGSRLSKYFNHFGIHHPDGMSGIIMRSYHRYLRNEDIRLEEQILRYHDFMQKHK